MPAIKSCPMQMVRVRSSKIVAPPFAAIPRPRHATGAASAGLPERSCSAARLVVDKLFRD
jgi:hypothetical protein